MEGLSGWPHPSDDDGRTWTESQREKWRQLAPRWHEAPAPASPSAEDVEHFISICERRVGRDGALALMGCTPAIRRAIGASSVLGTSRLYCVDFSPEMWDVTTTSIDRPVPGERFLESPWQRLHEVLPEPVDVVLGDKSLDNVAFREWPALFTAIHAALKPAGQLVVHVGLVERHSRPLDVPAVVDAWTRRLRSGEVERDDAAAGLWEDLLTGSILGPNPPDPYRLTIGVFSGALKRIRVDPASSPLQAELLARFDQLFSSSFGDAWTAFTMEELLRESREQFEPIAAYWSTDYEAAVLQPILELRAR